MAFYTVNDVLVKELLLSYPAGETIFIRGIMCSLLIGAAALAFGNAKALRGGANQQRTHDAADENRLADRIGLQQLLHQHVIDRVGHHAAADGRDAALIFAE